MNKRVIKEYKNHLWKSIVFWILAMALFGIFRYYAINDEIGIAIETSYKSIYSFWRLILGFSAVGFFIGLIYGTVEYFFDRYLLRNIPLWVNIISQAIIIFIALIGISELGITFSYRISGFDFPLEEGWWYKDHSFLPALLYIVVASFVFSLVIIVSEKFGKGVFFRLLIGSYKHPKETQRIFMFIDLKSSTTIAEQLGHLKYSQLIQDCFYDLNELVATYRAEIYQYVGDEAVLSWPFKNGIENKNCIHQFFAFQNRIEEKRIFYMNKYGLVPQFKAGVHGGNVMVAEVGVIKKELAYYGDVVNTTARIQGACNQYKTPFLISEELLNIMNTKNEINTQLFGNVILKGKQKKIKICSVSPLL